MEQERLDWIDLKTKFGDQWVEMIDFEWDWDKSFPAWAVIRHHSSDRDNLNRLIEVSGEIEGAVVIHLGATQSVVTYSDSVVVA